MTKSRPSLHITPERGWLSDPNGLVRHRGRYHVFHQANPRSTEWGSPQWNHVSSADLLTWQREPTALEPSPGPDAGGVWSGCVVIDGDIPTAVYTGVEALGDDEWTQTVCVATGDQDLRTWRKDPSNPVIVSPPADLAAVGFRDPSVWAEDDGWAMVVGTGILGAGGAVALFRSTDLRGWTYEGLLLQATQVQEFGLLTGRIWECPHLARVGGRDVLVFSVWDDALPWDPPYAKPEVHYSVIVEGEFDGNSFHPASVRRLDAGPDFYAAALLRDGDRTLVWGWSWEALGPDARRRQGWAGALTFPRELVALQGRRIAQRPAKELQTLRQAAARTDAFSLDSGAVRVGNGDPIEVEVTLVNRDAVSYGVDVLASDDGREGTRVSYDVRTRRLTIDRTRSSLSMDPGRGTWGGELPLRPDDPLRLRIFVDRSIVEVFANDDFALTARAYPTSAESRSVRVFAEGGLIQVSDVATWSLRLPIGHGAPGPAQTVADP